MPSVRLLVASLLVFVTIVGCEGKKNSREDALSSRGQLPSPTNLAALEPKTLRDTVRYENGFLTIDVRNASLDELLRRIAKLARFRLENNLAERQSFDISLTHVPLEEGLRVILGDIPHKLSYESIEPGPIQKISHVRVGVPEPSIEADLLTFTRQKLEAAKRNAHHDKVVDSSLTREQLDALTGPERLERLSQLPPSAENMPLLLDVLRHDSQSDMKIAAMASLENSDAPEAIRALQESLGESDAEVVLAAIDSIEFAGDNTQIPALTKLLQHPNSEVREAAAEAIDFLR